MQLNWKRMIYTPSAVPNRVRKDSAALNFWHHGRVGLWQKPTCATAMRHKTRFFTLQKLCAPFVGRRLGCGVESLTVVLMSPDYFPFELRAAHWPTQDRLRSANAESLLVISSLATQLYACGPPAFSATTRSGAARSCMNQTVVCHCITIKPSSL